MGSPDNSTLWRISAYERLRAQGSGLSPLSSNTVLPTTLVAELDVLQREPPGNELLGIVAACVRHRESALLMLRHRGLLWPLTLFPRSDLYHVRRPIIDSLAEDNRDLELLATEPPGLRPPGHTLHERIGAAANYHPLRPLLWALALHMPHAEPLRELLGRAAYRLAPDFSARDIAPQGALGPALARLHTEIASLADIAAWPGMDRERATRLLNGAYLLGGLMILRTHHAARRTASLGERWRGWRRRQP